MLVAVRSSSASFGSLFEVRSESFESALSEADDIGRKLELVAADLVDELYRSVPRSANTAARRMRLAAKRSAFNLRPVERQCLPCLEEPARELAGRFDALFEARQAIIARAKAPAMAELRKGLARVAGDARFRLAVDYSCPWLLGRFRKCEPGGDSFEPAERSLYAYAARFFSKANPCHVFAGITLASEPRRHQPAGDTCEILLDTEVIRSVEKASLRGGARRENRLLYFRPHWHCGGRRRFYVADEQGPRMVTLESTPVLERAIAYLRHNHPVSLLACTEDLATAFPDLSREDVDRHLSALIRLGVLVEYLARDLDHCAQDLDAPVLQLHMHRVPLERLPETAARLEALRDGHESPAYFVNLYRNRSTDAEKVLADSIRPALEVLRPFFLVWDNYAPRGAVIRASFSEIIRERGRDVPFLEALTEYLRDPMGVAVRHAAEPHNARSLELWREQLQSRAGELTASDIQDMLAACPARREASLCFNGPLDLSSGMFYPTNIFPGRGRFLARYFLSTHAGAANQDGPAVDVQLVAPFKGNRGYVRAMFDTGCSFDGRERQRFRNWIDPSDIMVGLREGKFTYFDRLSGRPLRFHFHGFVLAEYLPPEYQLLLADHADTYQNPFPKLPDLSAPPDGDQHVLPLSFANVCLRREEWFISQQSIEKIMGSGHIVDLTFRLRDAIHTRTSTGCDRWYYRRFGPAGRSARPRYLDLRNPLSVAVFDRDQRRVRGAGWIGFTRMEPPLECLSESGGEQFTSEVMIEI